jgi:sarcosine oxidase subunit alpha
MRPAPLDVYTNTFSTLKVGRVRYGLVLRERACAGRWRHGWAIRHFVMTTTTAAAGLVMRHLGSCFRCYYDPIWT